MLNFPAREGCYPRYRMAASRRTVRYVPHSDFPIPFQSRSQSFVPLDQQSENESSGSIHFEIAKEITEFCTSGFTAHCAVCIYGIYGACLKWMLPEFSFSDRWSRGTKLWERDCSLPDLVHVCHNDRIKFTIACCFFLSFGMIVLTKPRQHTHLAL